MARAHDEVHAAYPALEQHVTECTGSYPDNVCDISQGMTGFGWNHEWDMSIAQAIEAEAQAQAICMQTKDFDRACQAFMNRERPAFEGD